MVTRGEFEIREVGDIPRVINEQVTEKLVFSAYDIDSKKLIHCYLRTAKWETLENETIKYVFKPKLHVRQFLVLRTVDTDKKSKYYHLSKIKDLSYGTWSDWRRMIRDIKENLDLDVEQELYMGRVFCDNKKTAEYFEHIYVSMLAPQMRELL